jgi:hypothetical protein
VLKDTGASARRMTFLIGPDGRVAKVWGAVEIKEHVSDAVDSIQGLIESAEGQPDPLRTLGRHRRATPACS